MVRLDGRRPTWAVAGGERATLLRLVVSGLVGQSGLAPFAFFEILPLGLPLALVGGVVLVVLAPMVLPDRRSSYAQVASQERDDTFRLQVESGGEFDGHDVAGSGLRNLDRVYLAGLRRGDLEVVPVTPTTLLRAGDVLTFVGAVDSVVEVAQRPGLAHADLARSGRTRAAGLSGSP